MLPAVEELKSTLAQQLPGVSLTVEGTALIVPAKDLLAVCRLLKDTDQFRCDYVANLTAVDYLANAASGEAGRLQMIYQLYSMAQKHGPVTLKVNLPRQQPVVASVTPLWRAAEFQEREVYDLYGVNFEGHPDLRRILMWDEFVGHPMRKDYVPEDQNVL